MAKLLERHGRAEESLSFYRESITLTREDCISETRMLEPTQGTRVLVMRLVNFGFAFQRTPSPDQALPILQEAVTHLRILIAELTAREDEGLQETFGLALFRIGTIFYNAQSPREALSPLRESFDVFKKLDAAWVPLKYQRSLRNVADYLQKVVNLLDDGKSEDLIEIKGMLGGLRPLVENTKEAPALWLGRE
ncbi:hypothetical protein DL93DRAFT_2103841 [Clavulina sp. PMI_390]|nr:hypothetical protein DL93DRAFT_2103841 [Clavulina sp. PMI_390]